MVTSRSYCIETKQNNRQENKNKLIRIKKHNGILASLTVTVQPLSLTRTGYDLLPEPIHNGSDSFLLPLQIKENVSVQPRFSGGGRGGFIKQTLFNPLVCMAIGGGLHENYSFCLYNAFIIFALYKLE